MYIWILGMELSWFSKNRVNVKETVPPFFPPPPIILWIPATENGSCTRVFYTGLLYGGLFCLVVLVSCTVPSFQVNWLSLPCLCFILIWGSGSFFSGSLVLFWTNGRKLNGITQKKQPFLFEVKGLVHDKHEIQGGTPKKWVWDCQLQLFLSVQSFFSSSMFPKDSPEQKVSQESPES